MSIRRTRWALFFLPAALLSGCADYMSHRDTVTFGAGNALETNMAIHTVKPFPTQAYNTNMDRDGNSVANAQERYLTPGDPEVPGSEDRAATIQ